jgi:ubiquinone/menaquinone biosynthesis C-methylase UbiE
MSRWVSRTAATYDRIATRYAERATYPLERELARFRQMVPTGGLVLDVGCGPGQYTQALEARKLRVAGIDISSGMLQQAQANGAGGRRWALWLVRADMRYLPIADARADGCFACASLLHLPRTQAPQALGEFRRVLNAGGALYVGVKEGEGEKWVADLEGRERFFAYYQMEEIDWLIQAAGFEVVDGWTSPPGQGQRHNWLNRFAVARPWTVHP